MLPAQHDDDDDDIYIYIYRERERKKERDMCIFLNGLYLSSIMKIFLLFSFMF